MTKYKAFFNQLETVLASYSSEHIKSKIGDSVNNHRVVTVNQVIRFLTTRRNPTLKELGQQLAAVYEELKVDIANFRAYTSRTDAFDINEFINAYNSLVLQGTTGMRRTINQTLKAA